MFLKKTICALYTQKQKLLFLLLIASIILFALPHETEVLMCSDYQIAKSEQQHAITVWVHGTLFSQKLLQKMYQYIKTPIYLLFGKQLPCFHIPLGLHQATQLSDHSYIKSILVILQKAYQDAPLEDYYAFGWSGKLSVKHREMAGKEFYKKLQKLRKEYIKKHHVTPYFRIITHSHGGAVALYLATQIIQDDPLFIDELILLACPVQKQTSHLSHHSLFKNIYSLYSDRDILQCLDPQKLQTTHTRKTPLFSERQFPHHQKIRQVQVIMNGKHLWHIDFMLSFFLEKLPYIISYIDHWFTEKPLQTYTKRVLRLYTHHHVLKRHARRLQRKGFEYVVAHP